MAELLTWLGLPAFIAVAFAAIFGAFAALEKVTSPTKKAELASLLRSADWTALPFKLTSAFREAFEAIFGTSQFSGKCLRRSVEFSFLAIITLLALGFLKHYSYFRTMPDFVLNRRGYQIIFFGWLLWSMFFDYFSLYKTRLLIRLIDNKEIAAFIFLFLVTLDLSLSFIVFVFSQNYLHALQMVFQLCYGNNCSFEYEAALSVNLWKQMTYDPMVWGDKSFLVLAKGPIANEVAIFFWSGLLPTLWLLMYVLATALTRWLVRISDLISFTFSWLDTDKPFQAIGIVAAAVVSLFLLAHALLTKLLVIG